MGWWWSLRTGWSTRYIKWNSTGSLQLIDIEGDQRRITQSNCDGLHALVDGPDDEMKI